MSDQSQRRDVLRAALALGAALPALKVASAAEEDPAKARPEAGDGFVYISGDKKGQRVLVEDLPLGGPQVMVWPVAPDEIVRSGSRLNQVILIRLVAEELSDDARANAAEGVVAYSAACTHQACPVSMWKADKRVLYCACHGSEYDPRDAARVVAGPAPRRLAMLPLKVEGGELMAAGPFTGRVGGQKR